MNKIILGVIVLLVLGGVAFFVYSNMNSKSSPSTTSINTETQASTVPVAEGASTEIKNFKHSPNRLTVKAGEIVSVTNRDIVGHTTTSDTEGLFDTGLIGKDETKTFKAPEKPGEYPYHCTPHPNMTAVLVVE